MKADGRYFTSDHWRMEFFLSMSSFHFGITKRKTFIAEPGEASAKRPSGAAGSSPVILEVDVRWRAFPSARRKRTLVWASRRWSSKMSSEDKRVAEALLVDLLLMNAGTIPPTLWTISSGSPSFSSERYSWKNEQKHWGSKHWCVWDLMQQYFLALKQLLNYFK